MFILVEGTLTFAGINKKLYYNENKIMFNKFNDKIIHIIVDDFPNTNNPWIREFHQRNCIIREIESFNLNNDDLIIISDVDEIISSKILQDIKYNNLILESEICIVQMCLYYYNCEWSTSRLWNHVKLLKNKKLKDLTNIKNIRHFNRNCMIIKNGGWHLSYFGDSNFLINKIKSYSEQQTNNDKNINSNFINECIKSGKLYFNDEQLINIPIDDNKNLPYLFIKNKVPKIGFTFWEGLQLSFLHYMTIFFFSKLNPSFKIVIYYSNKEENFIHSGNNVNKIHPSGINIIENKCIPIKKLIKLPNVELVNINVEREYNLQFNTSAIHKADIVRIIKLYEHGGIWFDLDVLFIKPIPLEIMITNNFQYFSYYNTVATGLLISTPNNVYMKYIYEKCIEKINSNNINDDWQQFGPSLWRNCILNNEYFNNCK